MKRVTLIANSDTDTCTCIDDLFERKDEKDAKKRKIRVEESPERAEERKELRQSRIATKYKSPAPQHPSSKQILCVFFVFAFK